MNVHEETPGPQESVKSAQRTLAILELLTGAQQPLAFAEIAARLGYPRSSLHGLLRTLVESGWLDLVPEKRAYSLGIRVWEAGNAYLCSLSLVDRARPYMARVRDALDETVQLAVLDGRDNIYVAKADGSQRLMLASEVGRRLRAHATGLGKVLLAGLDPEELERRLPPHALERFTPNTLTQREDLISELERVRRRGYGADCEEYTLGVRCVAVPIFDSAQEVVAAMSVSVPTVRFDRRRQQHALLLLRQSAAELSGALGHRPAGRVAGGRGV